MRHQHIKINDNFPHMFEIILKIMLNMNDLIKYTENKVQLCLCQSAG